ncbi:MAG: hypothetical protein IPQ28_11770 [Sphingobacteriales bacterium]|nr:hypothetical protein [Sphingobacteriales bacterium]
MQYQAFRRQTETKTQFKKFAAVPFSSWKLVYYFTKWKKDGTIELIHEILG